MRFKTILLGILLALASKANCQKLSLIWETDTLLNKPESAIFDSQNKVIYVSSINGEYCTKDGNGFISKVDLDGNILDLKWVDGLDSPQGMGIFGNSLYVADLDKVVEIDIPKRQISHTFNTDSAKFLNDISVDEKGIVYISDCFADKIYRIKDRQIEIWLENPLLKRPNGLLAKQDSLFILNMGDSTAYFYNLKEKIFSLLTSGIGNCDGIVGDGEDGFFVSGAWQGELFHLTSSGEKSLLLDLGKEHVIAADIWYVKNEHLLLIPTLNKTLRAYKLDK